MHTFLCTVCNYNESHSIHPGMLGNSYWRLPELTHELGLAHAFTEITSDRRLHRPLIRRVCVHNSGGRGGGRGSAGRDGYSRGTEAAGGAAGRDRGSEGEVGTACGRAARGRTSRVRGQERETGSFAGGGKNTERAGAQSARTGRQQQRSEQSDR